MPRKPDIAPDNTPPPFGFDAALGTLKLHDDDATLTISMPRNQESASAVYAIARMYTTGQLAVRVTIEPIQGAMPL